MLGLVTGKAEGEGDFDDSRGDRMTTSVDIDASGEGGRESPCMKISSPGREKQLGEVAPPTPITPQEYLANILAKIKPYVSAIAF
jgi:hypothetical protein